MGREISARITVCRQAQNQHKTNKEQPRKNEKHPNNPYSKGMSCQTIPRHHDRIQNT